MNTIPNFNVESKRRNFISDYVISHRCECHSYWDNISCFNGKHWKYILNIDMLTKLMGTGIYYIKVLCPLSLDSYTSLQAKVTRLSHHTPTISVAPQWSLLVVFVQPYHRPGYMCWNIYYNHDKITVIINPTNKAKCNQKDISCAINHLTRLYCLKITRDKIKEVQRIKSSMNRNPRGVTSGAAYLGHISRNWLRSQQRVWNNDKWCHKLHRLSSLLFSPPSMPTLVKPS